MIPASQERFSDRRQLICEGRHAEWTCVRPETFESQSKCFHHSAVRNEKDKGETFLVRNGSWRADKSCLSVSHDESDRKVINPSGF